MRRAVPALFVAGPAFAHGGHDPVPSALHGIAHIGGMAALAVLAGAAVVLLVLRSDRARSALLGMTRRKD